ncbi:hypothetical protein HKBW3C_01987 [Candidatus Hakubella thermalkaliphila]|nr:hypothetical protein HKBW3C_01987 [Candidatus Hakubella thermalkaliphila]
MAIINLMDKAHCCQLIPQSYLGLVGAKPVSKTERGAAVQLEIVDDSSTVMPKYNSVIIPS